MSVPFPFLLLQWIIPKKQVSICTNRGIVPTYSVKTWVLKILSVKQNDKSLLKELSSKNTNKERFKVGAAWNISKWVESR